MKFDNRELTVKTSSVIQFFGESACPFRRFVLPEQGALLPLSQA
jgi:hypothetical protein